jgi:hypothetical protein
LTGFLEACSVAAMFKIIFRQFPKLASRTEWQALLVAIAVLVANRMLELGLTEADVYAMFGGVAGYGVSRGLAKTGSRQPIPAVNLQPANVSSEDQ